jgi:HK97 gp10 family phage protein
MMEFGSLEALAHHLTSETVGGLSQIKRGLELSAELIEETAKSEIGEYQDEVAMFPAWAALAASTEADKASKGYPPNSPLLRTGEMRDSIQHEVGEWEATIGATDPKMVFHEFGTQKMPPRPVIGPALYRNLEKIQRLIGNAAVAGFVGGDPINPGLGYTIEGSPE